MDSVEKLLAVDCEKLSDFLPEPEEVKALNLLITDPESLLGGEVDENVDIDLGVKGFSADALPEMEVARDEDYHHVREEGLLETLMQQIMLRECEQNNDGLWLTSVLISRLAKNQVFGEGNKRTAYLTGVLFLWRLQDVNGFDGALIPDLNNELTRLISDVAITDSDSINIENLDDSRDLGRDVEDLYLYLHEGMCEFIKENMSDV